MNFPNARLTFVTGTFQLGFSLNYCIPAYRATVLRCSSKQNVNKSICKAALLPFSVLLALVALQKAVVGMPSSAPALRGEEPRSAFSYLGAPRAGRAAGARRAFAGTLAIFQRFKLQAGAVPGSSPRPSAARPDAAQGL